MLNKNDARNDTVIFITESSDHDRVACMICLQEVVREIEHRHKRTYENVYVWSDGMGSQFRSPKVFKLLASKGAMDGIGGTVKNVILRKVKSGQLMVNSPLEHFEIFKRWKENVVKMAILKSFFSEMQFMKILFPCSGMGTRMKSSAAILKPVKMMINVQNAREVTVKVKSCYVVQYVVNGTMKTVLYE